MNILDTPMYSAPTAGRLVQLTTNRVRRWLMGYEYIAGPEAEPRIVHKGPVISRAEAAESSYASFLDLVDLLFVKEFLNHGISLQKLRKALHEVKQILGGHHYARRDFFTDGNKIYLQVRRERNEADALLELLSGGQWVIAPIIKQLAHQIEFEQLTGFAQRWFPLGPRGLVVVDPKISFGMPSLMGRGISTANVYDLFLGESETLDHVCSWMNLSEREVQAAVKFERHLATA